MLWFVAWVTDWLVATILVLDRILRRLTEPPCPRSRVGLILLPRNQGQGDEAECLCTVRSDHIQRHVLECLEVHHVKRDVENVLGRKEPGER